MQGVGICEEQNKWVISKVNSWLIHFRDHKILATPPFLKHSKEYKHSLLKRNF